MDEEVLYERRFNTQINHSDDNNSHLNWGDYLAYCEYARQRWLGDMGWSDWGFRDKGVMQQMLAVGRVRYRSSVKNNDLVSIGLRVVGRNRRLRLYFNIQNSQGKVCFSGVGIAAFFDISGEKKKSIELPDWFLDESRARIQKKD